MQLTPEGNEAEVARFAYQSRKGEHDTTWVETATVSSRSLSESEVDHFLSGVQRMIEEARQQGKRVVLDWQSDLTEWEENGHKHREPNGAHTITIRIPADDK